MPKLILDESEAEKEERRIRQARAAAYWQAKYAREARRRSQVALAASWRRFYEERWQADGR